MRVCSRAHTLKDVRANVAKELPKKKSVRPSHYEVLAGYLDLIIPELDRVPYTDKLDLQPGVNIMDLAGMSDEMQSMVIRSTIEQIHRREKHTVLVLPEAWKFIPEGGRSAIFQALQTLIREGATNGNFVWLDAQDLAVVSKRILKSVSVWILGKQQEANEVARTINHLIEPLQIRPDMIKSLGVGQFLVCADSLPARKVYVQPRWLGELDAQAIARGEESVETAQMIYRQKLREIKRNEKPNIILPATGQGRTRDQVRLSTAMPTPYGDDRRGSGNAGNSARGTDPAAGGGDDSKNRVDVNREDETMWKERAEKAEAEVKRLQEDVDNLRGMLNAYRETATVGAQNGAREVCPKCGLGLPCSCLPDAAATFSWNALYDYVKKRALDDPGILEVLARRPELRLKIEPQTLEVDAKTLRGGIALLIHKGFFSAPKNGHTVFKELQRIGRRVASANVYRELAALAEMGFLTSESEGFLATSLKVTVDV
jgi:hypothetical protein